MGGRAEILNLGHPRSPPSLTRGTFQPLADLADFNEELHRRALDHPVDCLPAFEDAFEDVVRDQEGAAKVSMRDAVQGRSTVHPPYQMP